MAEEIQYIAEPTGADFHMDSKSEYKAISSAVGCGKSVICVIDLLLKMQQQAPNANGVRKSRWAVVRSTFGELKSTTIQTWQEWIPASICEIVYGSPIEGRLKMKLDDGTSVDATIYFIPLDKPKDLKKLLSMELTGGWINEAAEIGDEMILDNLYSRCARYPAKKDAPLTWSGVILDYNPPVKGSWLYKRFQVERLAKHAYYEVPPPVLPEFDDEYPDDMSLVTFHPNPDAENVQNHNKGYDYWLDMAEANRHNWPFVQRFVLGQNPLGSGGTPIFPQFMERRHVKNSLRAARSSYLVIGMDFGLTPAAVLGQHVDGRTQIIDECYDFDMSLIEFLEEKLMPLIASKYPGYKVIVSGDPAGIGRSQIDKRTPFSVLHSYGFRYSQPRTNAFQVRRDAVNWLLMKHDGFYIHENCEWAVQAMGGGYQWSKPNVGYDQSHQSALKNKFSHVADAIQYFAMYFKYNQQIYTGIPDNDWMFDAAPQAPKQFAQGNSSGFFFA